MSYRSLKHFIEILEQNNELHRVSDFVSPVLEMSEIADRLSKNKGKAVLFENNGTEFPVLMNAFGSRRRMLLALGLRDYSDYEKRLELFFGMVGSSKKSVQKIEKIFSVLRMFMQSKPRNLNRKGKCFAVAMKEPDLSKLPVLQCWPFDGGRFFTLPMVHTMDPDTGHINVGMYRMQVFGKNTTGMHWHRHKGGAAHFEKYKQKKQRMPVAVTLGGDPVYTYVATAPLPDMISEYAFAGFLRKKRVRLVKCQTCDIWVPEDVDFVLEGYIDPAEPFAQEGPFGDHTGFYSLPDMFPVFHVTHIFHRKDAVFPATVVGIPPMEDAFMGEATEQLFLPLIRKMIVPEIVDMHLPVEGGFHNLAIVSIKKSFPGQAVKVMNALWGAGQMMFVKNIIVTDEHVNVRNLTEVLRCVLKNCVFPNDFHTMYGPLDELDHASNSIAFGKKLGIDATQQRNLEYCFTLPEIKLEGITFGSNEKKLPFIVCFVNRDIHVSIETLHGQLCMQHGFIAPFVVYMDDTCSFLNSNELLWLFLANFDPERDIHTAKNDHYLCAGFDGTMKRKAVDRLSRYRPNVITSDLSTIEKVDAMWNKIFSDTFLESPSKRYKKITLVEGYLFDK